MDENPHKAPAECQKANPTIEDRRWSPFTWGMIGFGLGTLVVAQLILSVNRIDRTIWGAILGGIPTGLYFFMSAAEKRRQKP